MWKRHASFNKRRLEYRESSSVDSVEERDFITFPCDGETVNMVVRKDERASWKCTRCHNINNSSWDTCRICRRLKKPFTIIEESAFCKLVKAAYPSPLTGKRKISWVDFRLSGVSAQKSVVMKMVQKAWEPRFKDNHIQTEFTEWEERKNDKGSIHGEFYKQFHKHENKIAPEDAWVVAGLDLKVHAVGQLPKGIRLETQCSGAMVVKFWFTGQLEFDANKADPESGEIKQKSSTVYIHAQNKYGSARLPISMSLKY
eukprot:UN32817